MHPYSKRERRRRLMKRQDGICHYCKVEMTLRPNRHNTCTREHKQPRSQGGGNAQRNIVGACTVCNNARGDSDYLTFKSMVDAYGRPHGDPHGDRYRTTKEARRRNREADNALTAGLPVSRKDTMPSRPPDLDTIFSGTLGDKCGEILAQVLSADDDTSETDT